MIQWVLVILVIVSWVYCLVSLWLTWTFFRHAQDRHSDFTPPVSILKAVKDVDAEEYENFASFCRQDYPEYELLFGVANASDPVIDVVKRLQRDFPERHIRLVVHQPEHLNRKASMLEELSKLARYDVLAASDSDMRVSRDYLRRVVAPLKDEHVGLVTCPYRADRPFTFTARLEALHMGVTFLPYVMVGRKFLNMRFALGSTNVLRRADLERIGGFAAVADFLADDYQLGKQIAQTGLSVYLSDYIMISVLGPTTFEEQWDRELRWAQCTRMSRPLEYPGLVLSFTIPLAVVLLLVSGMAPWAWNVLLLSLVWRGITAYATTFLTNDTVSRHWLFWLPLRDMLSALVWCAGLVGKKVTWRGEQFLLDYQGHLLPLDQTKEKRKWYWG